MFCSHCGKTLDPSTEKCPHCGVALGASRMSGHTSVQTRRVPPDQEQEKARYTPYTKTSYTGEMDAGSDVYSRTAYRPVLAQHPEAVDEDQDAPQDETRQAQEDFEQREQADEARAIRAQGMREEVPAQVEKVKARSLDELQKSALRRLEEVPDDAPELDQARKIVREETGIQIEPLKPIKKRGISPEVEGYIQRMEAMKEKKSTKRRTADEADERGDAPAPDAAEDAQVEQDGIAQVKSRRGAGGGARKWVGRIAAALLIVALIGGGLVYLAYSTQPKSQVEGVTQDVFSAGVTLIETRLTDDYRKNVIKLYSDDMSGAKALEQQSAAKNEILALTPEKPLENDQKFIDTLLNIQTAVDTATATDAMALLLKGDSSLSGLAEDSAAQWRIIENYVNRLKAAPDPAELDVVSNGVRDVMATPAPTPEPTPAPYKTIKRGDMTSKAVARLQERLRELGYLNGNVDGDYGSITQNAVKRFQKDAGMTQDAIATSAVQELLFSDDAPRAAKSVIATPAPNALDPAS